MTSEQQNSTQQIIIALTKGRILQETLPLLAKAGVTPEEDISRSRKLIFATNQPNIRMLVIRGVDVPTYVEHGVADLGVSGKDILLERGAGNVYEPLDLNIARCRLMTAALKSLTPPKGRIRVATKFVNVAKRFYAEKGVQADIIKLNGAMELAPLMGLADYIVDIVDSGKTLKANGLEPLEEIASISTRIIVNKAAMKVKHQAIHSLLKKLSLAVAEAKR